MQQTSEDSYFNRLRNLNIGLSSAVENKDKAKNLFLQVIKTIKEYQNYVNNRNNGNGNNRNQNIANCNQQSVNFCNANPNPNPNNNNVNNITGNDGNYVNNSEIYFEMELQILVKNNMETYFELFKNSRDMQQGLVFLGNLILYHKPNFAKNMVSFLKPLANFYVNLDCQESNYNTLALMTQILEANKNNQLVKNTNNGNGSNNGNMNNNNNMDDLSSEIYENNSNTNTNQNSNSTVIANGNANRNCNNNPNEWMNKKSFVVKILATDFEEYENNDKKKKEMIKMISVVMSYFSKNLEKIREFRNLNQMKLFLLQSIKTANEMANPNNNNGNMQKYVGNLVYCLCQLTNYVKFSEKEILKNKTIEILVQLIDLDTVKKQSALLLFGALKLLKVFWRASIRKSAMIKQGLVTRLLSVYTIQPKLILGFIEEVFVTEQQKLIDELPQFFSLLLETVYRAFCQTSGQDVQNLQRILYKSLGDKSGKLLQHLEQGVKIFVTKQYSQAPNSQAMVNMFIQHIVGQQIIARNLMMQQLQQKVTPVVSVAQNLSSLIQNQNVQMKNDIIVKKEEDLSQVQNQTMC